MNNKKYNSEDPQAGFSERKEEQDKTHQEWMLEMQQIELKKQRKLSQLRMNHLDEMRRRINGED